MLERDPLVAEANRQFTICNACRYCEDYCAVFPAMELRTGFSQGDVSYLANVCYDCRACYQACPYTDPHEFAINIPALMAVARTETYERYARPRWLARVFTSGPIALGLLTTAVFVLVLACYAAFGSLESLGDARRGPGSFYEVVSHAAMTVPALLLTAWFLLVAGMGFVAFWRDSGGAVRRLARPGLWHTALSEAATMRWMRGSGGECFYPDEDRPSPLRRRMHHLVAYGFLATFAATVSAWIGETFLGSQAPFSLLSAPVVLGVAGGIGVIVGCVGLIAMHVTASRRLTTESSRRMTLAFIVVLLAVSVTGMLLLVVRSSSVMGTALLVHLATVAALYLTAPYGKLMHAVYRLAATLRSADERAADAA